jgi:uncharacterized protein YraI
MKRTKPIFILYVIVSFLLGACTFATAGPQTWIDKPLDNTTLPLAPIFIMAHASDSDGITSMEFYVNGQLQPPSVTPVQDTGVSLAHAEKEFNPPGPGEYQIEVIAIDSTGNTGAPASVTVTVSDEAVIDDDECPPDCPIQPEEVPEDDCPPDCPIQPEEPPPDEFPPAEPPSEASEEELEEAPAVTVPSVVAKVNANCREGPGMNFEVYGNLLEGEEAEIKGRLSDNSWLLVALVGRSSNCWIAASILDVRGDLDTVTVAGASQPSANEPPSADEPPSAEEPSTGDVISPETIDTTPPGIFGAATNKSSMCSSEIVTANVVTGDEESPVQRVFANWILTGPTGNQVESGYEEFAPISGQPYGYTAQFGPFGNVGTLTINGTIENSLSPPLSAYFTLTVTISPC